MRTFVLVLYFTLAVGKPKSSPAVLLAGDGFFNSADNPPAPQLRSNDFQETAAFQVAEVVVDEVEPPQETEYSLDGVFEPLNLPAGASLILGRIDTSFKCGDYPYGYYSDEYNYCRVFHVCLPFLFEDGHIEPTQYSFMCSGEGVFDQQQLACVDKSAAGPCEESHNLYSSNEVFGLPHEKV